MSVRDEDEEQMSDDSDIGDGDPPSSPSCRNSSPSPEKSPPTPSSILSIHESHSPSTSPYQHSSCSSIASSPVKRKRRKGVSLSTLKRRRQEESDHSEEKESEFEEKDSEFEEKDSEFEEKESEFEEKESDYSEDKESEFEENASHHSEEKKTDHSEEKERHQSEGKESEHLGAGNNDRECFEVNDANAEKIPGPCYRDFAFPRAEDSLSGSEQENAESSSSSESEQGSDSEQESDSENYVAATSLSAGFDNNAVGSLDSSDREQDNSSDREQDNSSDCEQDNSSDREQDDSSEDEGAESLYDGAELSVNDALYRVLKLYVQHKWTKASLDQNIKIIKNLLPQPNDFPSSGKAALKTLKKLSVESYSEEEFSYCPQCLQLVPTGSQVCGKCEPNEDVNVELEKFYIFPPKVQFKHMFEQRNLADVMDQQRQKRLDKNENCISDITDGLVYRAVKERLQGQYDITLLLNTDGVALSGSSKQELWLILGTICEVPPLLRPCYMVVLGVYVSKTKPDMNLFLEPLSTCLQNSFQEGVTWVHCKSRIAMTSKIVSPHLSCDAPAKAMVLKVVRYNARYGCNVCEQKTKKIELTPAEVRANEAQPNPRKRIRRKRCFLFEEDVAPARLRTGPRMNAQGDLAEEKGKPRKGVLGAAVVSNFPFFDRAYGVCAEYMHLILLGVVKYFLEKIFFENKGAWFIGNREKEINQFISKIKVPDFVKRLPRGIGDFVFWKASEFRNFLLYYSLPLFQEISLPSDYFQHWLLLVAATNILLQNDISENELRSADIMLKAFVRDVGLLYGPKCYTYNVHNLVHVCLLVRRSGPLWSTSAFAFESFNGFVSALVHGTKNLGKEIVNNINISQSVTILGNIVNAQQQCSKSRVNSSLYKVQLLGKALNKCQLTEDELGALGSSGFDMFECYIRIKMGSLIYSSHYYDSNKKRSDSYVQFEVDECQRYGEVILFVKRRDDESVFCLLKVFNVQQDHLFFHESSRYIVKHLLPVSYSGEFIVVPAHDISLKMLKVGMYLARRPNSVEVNL